MLDEFRAPTEKVALLEQSRGYIEELELKAKERLPTMPENFDSENARECSDCRQGCTKVAMVVGEGYVAGRLGAGPIESA